MLLPGCTSECRMKIVADMLPTWAAARESQIAAREGIGEEGRPLGVAESLHPRSSQRHAPGNQEKMVLPVRIELTTSALPRMRSTTELRQQFPPGL